MNGWLGLKVRNEDTEIVQSNLNPTRDTRLERKYRTKHHSHVTTRMKRNMISSFPTMIPSIKYKSEENNREVYRKRKHN